MDEAAGFLSGSAMRRVVAAVQEALLVDGPGDPAGDRGGGTGPGTGAGGVDVAGRLGVLFGEAKPALRTGIWLLYALVEVSPLLHRFSRFSRLGHPDRVAWLEGLARHRRSGLRSIALALRALTLAVVYDDPGVLERAGIPDVPRAATGEGS